MIEICVEIMHDNPAPRDHKDKKKKKTKKAFVKIYK